MFKFRNPIQIQFRNDDFGIKRMIFKTALVVAAVTTVVVGGVFVFLL